MWKYIIWYRINNFYTHFTVRTSVVRVSTDIYLLSGCGIMFSDLNARCVFMGLYVFSVSCFFFYFSFIFFSFSLVIFTNLVIATNYCRIFFRCIRNGYCIFVYILTKWHDLTKKKLKKKKVVKQNIPTTIQKYIFRMIPYRLPLHVNKSVSAPMCDLAIGQMAVLRPITIMNCDSHWNSLNCLTTTITFVPIT